MPDDLIQNIVDTRHVNDALFNLRQLHFGIFDMAGTIASGWLTDRVDSRILLAIYYGGRGLSLLAIDAVLAPDVQPALWVFIVFYGLDWVATVPPTVGLVGKLHGIRYVATLFGIVMFSHQICGFLGAWLGGYVRNDVIGVLFFAAAAGAAFEVVVEVGRWLRARAPGGLTSGWALGGFLAGVTIMYVTGLLAA